MWVCCGAVPPFLFDPSLTVRRGYIQFIFILIFSSLHIHSRRRRARACLSKDIRDSSLFFFILPFLPSFVSPFCRNLSRTSQTFLPHTFPQTEDSTQLPICTDASHSTVTNGTWASCPSCPPPVLKRMSGSPMTWYSYDEASDGPIHLKCLSVSWPSVWRWLLTFHILPSCVVLCSFFVLFTSLCFVSLWWKFNYDPLVTEYEHVQTHFWRFHPPHSNSPSFFFSGKQPDGAVENNQNKGKILGCVVLGCVGLCVFSCLA